MTEAAVAPASDPTAGLFDGASGTQAAPPDFTKMKKAELIAFYEANYESLPPEQEVLAYGLDGFAKLKVVEMKAELKAAFPDPEALDHPDVTGFDPGDVIHATVAAIQGIETEAQAIAMIQECQDTSEFHFFKIGGVLAKMQTQHWSGEYDDFYTFVDATFGYKIRKAQILVGIYHKLSGCGATWAEAKAVGWGKLAVIATHLEPENYKDWFKKASSATHAELAALVKAANANGSTPDPNATSTPLKKLTFQVHEDQEETIGDALKKAKEDAETEFDAVALEAICGDYLAGDAPVAAEVMQKAAETHAAQAVGAVTIDPENLGPAFEAIVAADPEEGLVSIMEAYCATFPEIHVELFPDGKPELSEIIAGLLEEYGGGEILEALKGLEEE